MDSILASTDDEARARLLRILQEFLSAEAEKHAAKEKGKSQHLFTHHVLVIAFRKIEGKAACRECEHGRAHW